MTTGDGWTPATITLAFALMAVAVLVLGIALKAIDTSAESLRSAMRYDVRLARRDAEEQLSALRFAHERLYDRVVAMEAEAKLARATGAREPSPPPTTLTWRGITLRDGGGS